MCHVLLSRSVVELWAGMAVCSVLCLSGSAHQLRGEAMVDSEGEARQAGSDGFSHQSGPSRKEVSRKDSWSTIDISWAPELCCVQATSMRCPHVLHAGPGPPYWCLLCVPGDVGTQQGLEAQAPSPSKRQSDCQGQMQPQSCLSTI